MPEFSERAPQRKAHERQRYLETVRRLQNYHGLDLTLEVTTTV